MAIRHYEIEFTTKGPVHIGNGEKYGKKDYFQSGGKIAILDVRKFVARLTPEQISNYCNFLESDEITLQDYLEGDKGLRALAESSVLYKADTDLARARRGSRQRHDVWECIKDAEGRPYVPGSSVKGMIRTALLVSLLLDDPDYRGLFDPEKVRSKQGRKSADKDIQRRAFWREVLDQNNPKELTDVMRYVSVSDSEPLSLDDLVFAKKYDRFCKDDKGWHKKNMGNVSDKAYYEGNELNIYRESIRPDTRFTVSVDIDDRIDGYLAPLVLDADGLQKVLERSFELYKKCFLDRFDVGGEASVDGGTSDGKCRYINAAGPLAGTRCRNNAVDGTGYCNIHKDRAGEESATSSAPCYLGGGIDFDSKTVLNALFPDDLERLAEASGILYSQFPTKIDFALHPELVEEVRKAGFEPESMVAKRKWDGRLQKGKDDHRHWKDVELGVSPHTMKFGIVGKERLPMGKCVVRIRER